MKYLWFVLLLLLSVGVVVSTAGAIDWVAGYGFSRGAKNGVFALVCAVTASGLLGYLQRRGLKRR